MPSNQPEPPTLLPCPFCGGKGHQYGDEAPFHPSWLVCRVHCLGCKVTTCWFATPAEAAAAWNRRAVAQPETPTTDALDAAVAKARNALLVSCGKFRNAHNILELVETSKVVEDATAALVAAVEARAVARERGRECVWTENERTVDTVWEYRTACGGGSDDTGGDYCQHCGGRVRVVER